MAYISSQDINMIRKSLKAKFPEYKFSVKAGYQNTGIDVAIMSGPRDFAEELTTNGYCQINEYHLGQYGSHEAFLFLVLDAIKNDSNTKWYNDSRAEIDYFDTAFYIHLTIGRYNKPYVIKNQR